jgi:hypothetical protein
MHHAQPSSRDDTGLHDALAEQFEAPVQAGG